MDTMLAHAFTRNERLYNPYASPTPTLPRPGFGQLSSTSNGPHLNSSNSGHCANSVDAASAHLLSLRYKPSPDDTAAQPAAVGQGSGVPSDSIAHESMHQSGNEPAL